MATPRKKPEDYLPRGRPSEFKPEYCEMLIEHMKSGGTIEAFASFIPCAIQTLYNWMENHPEFMEARKVGLGHLHQFYENLGKMIISGQLQRVKSEEPMLDMHGNVLTNPNTGEALMRRTYEYSPAGQSTFIFMTKNMLGWRDRRDIELSGKDGGPIDFSNLSDAELQKRIDELVDLAQKKK